ncbi:hypothetical protein WNY63_05110 [Pseudoalteromonas neustonica]|uniref:Uncharacterized protein n=1 Tax=Pseudoalteromonas neustonica TaxID=1840331 RepID=A0ABU9TZZ3_9GAMM
MANKDDEEKELELLKNKTKNPKATPFLSKKEVALRYFIRGFAFTLGTKLPIMLTSVITQYIQM